MFKDIYVETENIILKPYSMDDFEDLYEAYSDKNVMKYIPEGTMTREWLTNLINWMVNYCYENNTAENMNKFGVSVEDKKTHRVIGWCGLGTFDCNPVEVEIFYGLRSEYWGRGFGTEAASAMLEYGFNTIGLKRIIALVNTDNIASQKVIKKIGLKYEKMFYTDDENFSSYNGEYYYALTRDEYNKMKNK